MCIFYWFIARFHLYSFPLQLYLDYFKIYIWFQLWIVLLYWEYFYKLWNKIYFFYHFLIFLYFLSFSFFVCFFSFFSSFFSFFVSFFSFFVSFSGYFNYYLSFSSFTLYYSSIYRKIYLSLSLSFITSSSLFCFKFHNFSLRDSILFKFLRFNFTLPNSFPFFSIYNFFICYFSTFIFSDYFLLVFFYY